MELAKRPIRADTGTPYPCTQEDLDYCLRFPRIKPGKRLHRMEATYQLTRFNRLTKELSPNERNACKNLKAALQLRDWGPDLIIKAFKDLDQLFFMGRLYGKCLVGWYSPASRKVSEQEYGVTSFVPPSSAQSVLICKKSFWGRKSRTWKCFGQCSTNVGGKNHLYSAGYH